MLRSKTRAFPHLSQFREIVFLTERTLPQTGLIISDRVSHLQLLTLWPAISNSGHWTADHSPC